MKDISVRAAAAGLASILVSATGTAAVILAGLNAAGATPEQAASGIMILMIFFGLGGAAAAVVSRQPIVMAWSTPGAALLISTGGTEGGFEAAVGAFIVTGALIVLTGIIRPLRRAVDAIPPALANAMLAGVLFGLCLEPVKAIAVAPWAALPVVFVWIVAVQVKKIWATPVAAFAAVIVVLVSGGDIAANTALPAPVFVMPEFTWAGVGVIALPMYIVTMTSQNIPAISVLRHNGFEVKSGPAVTLTGVLSMLAAPFGGHSVVLSSLVVEMCSGPEAHADPARRYWSVIVRGAVSMICALLAGLIVAVTAAAPPHLIAAIAGLALLGPLMAALGAALKENEGHEAALITFVVTASGFVFLSAGAAFWGIVLGGAVLTFQRLAQKHRG